MSDFRRLATGLNVTPLLKRIDEEPALWRAIMIRQNYPGTAHHDTQTIFLRGPRSFTRQDYFFDIGAFECSAYQVLRKEIDAVVDPVLDAIRPTEIGRMMIVNLRAGGIVDWHADEGDYADHYSRFHICLESLPGSVLITQSGMQHMRPGEAWWFNHKARHCARNNSIGRRVHLIFDAVSPLFTVGGENESRSNLQATCGT